MSAGIRVAIYNADEPYSSVLRSRLLEHRGVRIVSEVDEPALIPQAVTQFAADVLIINLDPTPDVVLTMVRQLTLELPQLAVFAVSQSTDGQVILTAMRSGVTEFITQPIDPHVLSAALEKVASRHGHEGRYGKLVTVIGSSGGVGATTIATNLATELRSLSHGDVCIVDLDYRFGQVSTFLDVEPSFTIADLCSSVEQLESQVVERALVKHPSGVRVLARPHHFTQADGITAAHCAGALSVLLQMHDWVVVDGPNRYDMGAKAIMDMADANLLVVQLLVPSVRSTARLLQGMREAGYNLDRMRLVCNRVRKDGGSLSLSDVVGTLHLGGGATPSGGAITIPEEWITVSEAINLGEPLSRHSPKSKVRQALQELAKQLHQGEEAVDELNSRNGGILSRIFSE